jgi:hypothetical protein
MPKYNGGSASTYLFGLVCFYIGLAVLTAVSLGQITCDERDGPGFNPFTKMPDGRLGISEFGVSVIGFIILMAVGWLISQIRFR